MIGSDIWLWLVVGLIPYYTNKQRMGNGWILRVRALCWSLEIDRQPSGQNRWTLCVSLIERLRNAVYTAIMHLRGDGSPLV
jgi:hypothetical protein